MSQSSDSDIDRLIKEVTQKGKKMSKNPKPKKVVKEESESSLSEQSEEDEGPKEEEESIEEVSEEDEDDDDYEGVTDSSLIVSSSEEESEDETEEEETGEETDGTDGTEEPSTVPSVPSEKGPKGPKGKEPEDEDKDGDKEEPKTVVVGKSKISEIDTSIQISDDEEEEIVVKAPKKRLAPSKRVEATEASTFANITQAQFDQYMKKKRNEPVYRYKIRMAVVESIRENPLTLSQIVTTSEAITNKLLTGAVYPKSFEDYLKSLKK